MSQSPGVHNQGEASLPRELPELVAEFRIAKRPPSYPAITPKSDHMTRPNKEDHAQWWLAIRWQVRRAGSNVPIMYSVIHNWQSLRIRSVSRTRC